jgi:hypothetical protein
MPVTITRSNIISLGEQTIRRAEATYGVSPQGDEAKALRQVLATTDAVVRGTNGQGDVMCPMIQAGIDLDANDQACYLALCWDRVTAAESLNLGSNHLICVNPLT